jgi:hypothetical protein
MFHDAKRPWRQIMDEWFARLELRLPPPPAWKATSKLAIDALSGEALPAPGVINAPIRARAT